MFSSVLLPVDDLGFAGRILWHVTRVLRRKGGSLTLLRAVKPPTAWKRALEASKPGARHPLPQRLDRAYAELEGLSEKLRSDGFTVAPPEVDVGDPAQVILSAIRRLEPSLVAMATHGRSGPARWALGSVTEGVLRTCPAPLLLCNSNYAGTLGGRAFRSILVPLDGSRIAESILAYVEDFAVLHNAEVLLLHAGHRFAATLVYPPPGPPLPPTPAELEAQVEGARDRLQKAGLVVRVYTPICDDVAEEILGRATSEAVDLVALATHGRSGIDRWLFGSVAEKVVRRCPSPVLVVRATGPVLSLDPKQRRGQLAS